MKNLSKLTINAEKVIKSEELINLRGGYDTGGYTGCLYYYSDTSGTELICCAKADGGGAPASYSQRTYNNCSACKSENYC